MVEQLKIDAKGKIKATMILAHGAGAPMDSEFMNLLCRALATTGISTVRFEFPYMVRRREEGTRRPPDRQPVLLQQWRDIYSDIIKLKPKGSLLIGGKSMGGRMASMIAEELQPDGFCCFGYPFYPPGKTNNDRIEHFHSTTVPGLILQGTRDNFGKPEDINAEGWPDNINLVWLEEGDHDYKVRKKSGLTQAKLIDQAASHVVVWLREMVN